MLLLVLAGVYFRDGQSPSEQLAFKTERADRVSRIQLDLSSASEAEKNAVMASTEDANTFALQARAATAEAEREYHLLDGMLKTGGTPSECNLLTQFSQAFAEFRHIDDELLTLATKNTNLKAYRLAYGPAADSLSEMNASLARVISANAKSVEATKIMLLAFPAETGALRLASLLAPHIAEERDEKMDELEAAMAKEDTQVRQSLADLKALPKVNRDADVAAAIASYEKFKTIKTEILALSRENSNVRSLAISLHQKRKVASLCQETLSALKQAILDEPMRGVERPSRPR
jgi:hypothetical protein